MKRFVLTLIIFAIGIGQLFAQAPWLKPFEDSVHLNFYNIQNHFYSTYHKQYGKYLKGLKHDGKEEEVGEQYGIVQFKRWENFWQPRVNTDGSFPRANTIYNELKKYGQQNITTRSTITAGNWTSLGPVDIPSGTGSGRINTVRFDPNNSNRVFVGAPDGGLWISTNGGSTWATTTDGLPSIGVTDVAIDPTNSNIIYIATGDGDASDSYSIGIMKSIDGGNTWDTTGLTYAESSLTTISRLLINPQNHDELFAASSKGICRSVDGGITWTKNYPVDTKDMVFKPFHSSTIYAAGTFFFKSTNDGVTWKLAGSGLPGNGVSRIALAVSNADSNTVLALVAESSDYGMLGLYKSTDGGDTFSLLYNTLNLLGWSPNGSNDGGQGWYDLSIAMSQYTTDTIFTGGVNVWMSVDGGNSFSLYGYWAGPFGGPYVHADDHFLTLSPDEKSIYVGCDGGIYNRPFTSSKWNDLSNGLSIMQIYSLSGSVTNSNLITTGAQDNGTCEMNGANNWSLIYGGDGMQTIIDYADPTIIYAEGPYGNIKASYDGGNSFNSINPNSNLNGNWVTPYVIDPNTHNILYAGLEDIYKTTNEGGSWTNMTNGLTNGADYVAIAVAPSNSNVIYAAIANNIYRSENGGTSWKSIFNNLPSFDITSIAVKGSDPYTLWVTFSGFNPGNEVYKSIDSGNTWTSISSGLPTVPTNCIVYQNNANDNLYVGTDLGVYYLNDSLSSWVSFNNGLPNVVIDQLSIQYSTGMLRAATYGRGVWQTQLVSPNTGISQVNFSDNINEVKIYPNPTTDLVNVEFEKDYSSPIVISFYNVLGQLVLQKTFESISNSQKLQFNLLGQTKGVYFIKITSGSDVVDTKKLVVIN